MILPRTRWRGGADSGILPEMSPTPASPSPAPRAIGRPIVPVALAIAAGAALLGCANDGQNLYQPPPDDGSANANSADVVTEPPVTPR